MGVGAAPNVYEMRAGLPKVAFARFICERVNIVQSRLGSIKWLENYFISNCA